MTSRVDPKNLSPPSQKKLGMVARGVSWVSPHCQSTLFGALHAGKEPYLKKETTEEWHLKMSYGLHIHQTYMFPHKHIHTLINTQTILYYTFYLVHLCGRARAQKEPYKNKGKCQQPSHLSLLRVVENDF